MGVDVVSNLGVSAADAPAPRVNVPASAGSAPVAQAAKPAAQPTRAAVQAAAQQLQDYVATAGRTLEFHLDEGTGMTVVTVKDSESGDVIRQIPSEEVLKIAESLKGGGHSASMLVSLTA